MLEEPKIPHSILKAEPSNRKTEKRVKIQKKGNKFFYVTAIFCILTSNVMCDCDYNETYLIVTINYESPCMSDFKVENGVFQWCIRSFRHDFMKLLEVL